MSDEHDRVRRVAVLIDGDNASPGVAEKVFIEAEAIGEVSVRRIYGDFSAQRLKSWVDVSATFAIVPQQQFATVSGKNATDIALVIDAMDLLHRGDIDTFCLVSSDGDFTRLATRIREQSIDVFGFGEAKAPASFRKACKRFSCTDADDRTQRLDAGASSDATLVETDQQSSDVATLLQSALVGLDHNDGWYALTAVGHRLSAMKPNFDKKTYGCSKLMTLVERSKAFEVKRHPSVRIRPLPHLPATTTQHA